jgi:hypothetical protein
MMKYFLFELSIDVLLSVNSLLLHYVKNNYLTIRSVPLPKKIKYRVPAAPAEAAVNKFNPELTVHKKPPMKAATETIISRMKYYKPNVSASASFTERSSIIAFLVGSPNSFKPLITKAKINNK